MSSSFTVTIVAAVVVMAAVASNGKDGGRRRASIAVEKADGTPCGTTTCAVGELCCDWTTCYNPSAGETCCAAAKDSEYPNSAICSSTQTCCGGDTAAVVTCIDPTNETCCSDFDAIATACGLGDTCCETWGPPTMFNCCGGEKHTTCCNNGEYGASADSICCAEGTTCCVVEDAEYVMCCNATERCGVDACLGLF